MRYSFDELVNPKDMICHEAAVRMFGDEALKPALKPEEEGFEKYSGSFAVFNRKYHSNEPFVLHEEGFYREFMAMTLDGRRAAVTACFVGDHFQNASGAPTAYSVFILDC